MFLAPEPLRPDLTGPARRAVKLAEAVAERCAVTLAAPAPSTFPEGPFRTLETGPIHNQSLAAAMAAHDVVVVQTLPSPRQLASAVRHAPHLVVDLIAPLALEVSQLAAYDERARDAALRWRAREMVMHVAAADLVLCTNEKQHDLVVGAALASGLLESDSGAPLAERLAIVPHGIDPSPPPRRGSPLRDGDFAGRDDRIAVWGGGIWSWLDPLTAIRAVERLRPSRPDLRLAFVGLEHPDPDHQRGHQRLADEAYAYVRDRALEPAVTFRPRWLPRDDYLDHLTDADVGVSLSGPTLEGRFASRTRVLDYLHAGLPVVCTAGDTMSELVASRGAGVAVEPLDVEGCAAALDRLTNGQPPRPDGAALEPFLWRSVARPLVEYCGDPGPANPRARRRALLLAARAYPSFLRSVYRIDGPGRLARAAATAGSRALTRGRRGRSATGEDLVE
jgi:glycosyltransferase involved in cell wall biosynthesis